MRFIRFFAVQLLLLFMAVFPAFAADISLSTVLSTLKHIHSGEMKQGTQFFETISQKNSALSMTEFFTLYMKMEEEMPKEKRLFRSDVGFSPVQQAKSIGLISSTVGSRDVVSQALFEEIIKKDMVLQRYKPYIVRYEEGLVRSMADITTKNFSSQVQVKNIIARYKGYLSKGTFPKWMQEEFVLRKKKFESLLPEIEAMKKKQEEKKQEASKTPGLVKLDVTFFKQERPLSCELASLRSLLAFYDVSVTEDVLVEQLGIATPQVFADGIWGDPQKGFVGDIMGKQGNKTGYGTYWKAIARVASRYDAAFGYFENGSLSFLARSLEEGKPVMLWGLYKPTMEIIPIRWNTPEGVAMEGYVGEHTMLLYAYEGTVDAPTKFWVIDPLVGKKSYTPEELDSMWKLFGRSGVRKS